MLFPLSPDESSNTLDDRANLPAVVSGWALAVFDANDWLGAVAEPCADFGQQYRRMIAMAETAMLGELDATAPLDETTEAALAHVEWRWADNVDDPDCRILAGFLRRSAPIEALADTWRELIAAVTPT